MARLYPASVAKRIPNVTQRRLEYWEETGLVRPSRPAKGKGSARQYSYEDLVALSVVGRLREAGLSLQKVRKGLQKVQERKKKAPLSEVLITDGTDFFWKRGESFIDLLDGSQMVFSVVAIGHVHREVQKVIEMSGTEPASKPKARRSASA